MPPDDLSEVHTRGATLDRWFRRIAFRRSVSGDLQPVYPARYSGASTAGDAADEPIATCMMLLRTAYSTSSLTECSLSLRMILLRWVSAVFTLKSSARATSLVDLPSDSNCTTWRSRGVRTGTVGACFDEE